MELAPKRSVQLAINLSTASLALCTAYSTCNLLVYATFLPPVTVKILFDENGKTHGRGITLPRQKTTVRIWIKCACHGGQAWSYGQSGKHRRTTTLAVHYFCFDFRLHEGTSASKQTVTNKEK